jgi:hypothetical protein
MGYSCNEAPTAEIHAQECLQTMGQVSPVPGDRGRPKKFPDTFNPSIALAVSSNFRLLVRAAAAIGDDFTRFAMPTTRSMYRKKRLKS